MIMTEAWPGEIGENMFTLFEEEPELRAPCNGNLIDEVSMVLREGLWLGSLRTLLPKPCLVYAGALYLKENSQRFNKGG